MDIVPEALAYNMRTERKRRGWGVREMGKRSGISGGTVSRLEDGKITQETEGQVPGIAAAIDMTVAELMAWPPRGRWPGPRTTGPYGDNHTSDTLGTTRRQGGQQGGILFASASSLADLLALFDRWSETMPDADYVFLTIEGDYLAPAVLDQERIALSLTAPAGPGSDVLARVGSQVVVGQLAEEAGARVLVTEDGQTIAASDVTILAVLLGWVHRRPPRPH